MQRRYNQFKPPLLNKTMENYTIHLTSGKGPAECALAVALALKALLAEAKEKDLTAVVVDRIPGLENRTLLSATVVISGKQAKTFCKDWQGVLLWICQSPFRKFHKRKNWFIGMQCADSTQLATWNEREIDFQTMRAGGPGGQHVNKVESAVRATHRPSGLTVTVNESRSQLQNKKAAVARLATLFEQWQLRHTLAQQQQVWLQHHTLERGNPTRVYEGLTFKRIKNGK